MKNKLFILVAVLAANSVLTAAPPATIAELTTLTGRTYKQCRISQVHPDGVSFFHANGAAKVLFDDLSSSWKAKLGYSPQRAAEHQKEQETRKFLQQQKLARQREEAARRQREHAELRLLVMERAALLRERQVLQAQQMLLAAYYGQAGRPIMPAPAVGWPGAYVGPVNQPAASSFFAGRPDHSRSVLGPLSPIHGPAFGGRDFTRRGSVALASIGGGSGGFISLNQPGCVLVSHGRVVQSPTLGAYVPGVFAPFGSTAPFGGVFLGGSRQIGGIGLSSVAFGFVPPATAICPPVIRAGSVGLPPVR